MKTGIVLSVIALVGGLLLFTGYRHYESAVVLSEVIEGSAPVEAPPSPTPALIDSRAPASDKTRTLILSAENTISFNEVVTESTVAQFQQRLQAMSSRLRPDQDIILVMHTPGGSVDAGMKMIDSIRAVPQKVKTLTLFAASMGFQVVQNGGERMITPAGILMSHRASGGVEGEFGGELDSRLNTIRRGLLYLDSNAAARMGLSLSQYRALIADEYWVYGFDAVNSKAADTVLLARCDASLSGTEVKVFDTMFGAIKVTFSKCPIITGPLAIDLATVPADNKQEVLNYVRSQYDNPTEFVQKWINNGKYRVFLKR